MKASAANQLSRHMNKSGAMLLVPVISDFDVEACATDVSVMDAMNRFALEDKRYQFYSYPRARLYLKMHWELRSIDNSQLLYTTNTETFVDNWSGKLSYRSIRDHMFFGIEQATQNLLADESFIQFLLPDPKAVVHIAPVVDKVAGETTPVVARVEENEGGFSMLRSLDNLTGGYLQAAKMARAMAIMAGIKIRVADYYSQYGKMPDSLEVIDVSIPQHVLADNYIRAISLKLDGTIQAALTDDFGDSRLLELTPEPVESIGMIHWTCYANVDKSILDKMSCKSI
ncbi:MAG: hypothetical protein EP315_03860 [Gammaproteobacteria bacterium]|nr:MAG: hypothetical protein EP315_03860 [Gammaproteobacteria bacterium]